MDEQLTSCILLQFRNKTSHILPLSTNHCLLLTIQKQDLQSLGRRLPTTSSTASPPCWTTPTVFSSASFQVRLTKSKAPQLWPQVQHDCALYILQGSTAGLNIKIWRFWYFPLEFLLILIHRMASRFLKGYWSLQHAASFTHSLAGHYFPETPP